MLNLITLNQSLEQKKSNNHNQIQSHLDGLSSPIILSLLPQKSSNNHDKIQLVLDGQNQIHLTYPTNHFWSIAPNQIDHPNYHSIVTLFRQSQLNEPYNVPTNVYLTQFNKASSLIFFMLNLSPFPTINLGLEKCMFS
jgi:hypothetical protein